MMSVNFSLFCKRFWIFLLFPAVLLVGCGTFEVNLEPTVSPEVTAATPVLTPTSAPTTESTTTEPEAIVTEQADRPEDMMALTGRAMAIDPPTGLVILLPE